MVVYIEINDGEYNETEILSSFELFDNWWIPGQAHGITIQPYPVQTSSWETSCLVAPLSPVEGRFYIALMTGQSLVYGVVDFTSIDYETYIRKTYMKKRQEERTEFVYKAVLYTPKAKEFEEKWPEFSRGIFEMDRFDGEFREFLTRNSLQFSEA